MKISYLELKIKRGDILEFSGDAIVNPANTQLRMGGGLALSIRKKGGSQIEKWALKFGKIKKGEAVLTPAGRLKSKFIIHSATMGMDFRTNARVIRKALRSSLELAREKKFRSIAIPALGCGTGKFPISEFAQIAVEELIEYVQQASSLRRVEFVLRSQRAFREFEERFKGYAGYLLRKLSSFPIPTVDAIVEISKDEILLIRRKNPPQGWALPGGFVEYNESLEDCVSREVEEEIGLKVVELRQFRTYSAPARDPRFHTISTVFILKTKGRPKAGSDASSLRIFKLNQLPPKSEFAFDHWQIIQDWIETERKSGLGDKGEMGKWEMGR